MIAPLASHPRDNLFDCIPPALSLPFGSCPLQPQLLPSTTFFVPSNMVTQSSRPQTCCRCLSPFFQQRVCNIVLNKIVLQSQDFIEWWWEPLSVTLQVSSSPMYPMYRSSTWLSSLSGFFCSFPVLIFTWIWRREAEFVTPKYASLA